MLKTFIDKMSRLARLAFIPLIVSSTCQLANAQIMESHAVSGAQFFIAFCSVVMVGIAANALLVGLVRPGATLSRWQTIWEFSPDTLGGFTWRSLALWSLL